MRPSTAEIARTLAAGHLPATLQVACGPGPLPLAYANDCSGQPLLLVPAGGPLAGALPFGDGDIAAVLAITDEPPVAGAPTLGQAWISGWVSQLHGAGAREAACEFAEANPLGDLLDVGRGHDLYRLDVAEVRLRRGRRLREVDVMEYLAADPDPLARYEAELLLDLDDHHGPQVGAFVRRMAAAAGLPPLSRDPDAPLRVVRLDRYGLVVRAEAGLVRLDFTRAVRDRHELADLLRPVLFGGQRQRTD
ncbi:DUF2470 domain-containing protein [Luedemannella helvata]|uniref:DUF2470 domain-containing protein n=1 Tax=Luedemannella helvata TaxID=349315 RepID=A0ABP4WRV2_9ACTN